MLKLTIGNKNYSSWSMRPWVLLKQAGIAFEEAMLRFDSFEADSAFKKALAGISPTGKVPLLVDGDLAIWDKDSKEALYVRGLGRRKPQTYEVYRAFVETRPAEVVANIAICLIHQTNYLLDQQLHRLEQDFVEQGGLRERMTRVRLQYRSGGKP